MVTTLAVVIIGGFVGPAILVTVAVLIPAAIARTIPTLVRMSLLLSLPIAISAVVVNVFFFPEGQDVILRLGPVTATREGLVFALEILVRILVISGAVTLFYLTTRPAELAVSLEARGVSPRIAFVTLASVQAVPSMVDRAAAIIAAQRARGLDTEGSLLRRARGVLPIVGPVVLGAIAEVEQRTMALEARGFTRPGRRTLLWHPVDSTAQRLFRWGLVLALVVLLAARLTGRLA